MGASRWRRVGMLVACSAAVASMASAESLTIGLRANSTSVDPHFHHGPNAAMSEHIYDALVAQDHRKQILPSLAVSWEPISENTWEFKLREGVTFHDGSPFTADDVVCSWARPVKITNSPGSFTTFTENKTVTKVDDYTVHFTTDGPYPQMVTDTAMIFIVSDENGCDASTDDFHNGEAASGTGPYKLAEFIPDQKIVLTANENYWGDAPEFSDITYLPINSDPSRVAALLSGDVDMIAQVPTADLAQLQDNPDIAVHSTETDRVIFLFPDHWRENSPHVKGLDGSEIKSPLLDNRVLKAMSKAINREAISERVMEGQSVPAGQILPEGFFGRSDKLSPEPYDPEGAKALLAEAGWGDGFKLRLHGPNDRYINDKRIL
ncbi:MAG: ABC transporter substrate-binding protein, partial [Geminicoccaceae bacterium]